MVSYSKESFCWSLSAGSSSATALLWGGHCVLGALEPAAERDTMQRLFIHTCVVITIPPGDGTHLSVPGPLPEACGLTTPCPRKAAGKLGPLACLERPHASTIRAHFAQLKGAAGPRQVSPWLGGLAGLCSALLCSPLCPREFTGWAAFGSG